MIILRNRLVAVFSLLILILFIAPNCISQTTDQKKNLVLRANAGPMIFFGDLSPAGFDLAGMFRTQTKFGIGGGIEKYISNKFSIGASLFAGKLSGVSTSRDRMFESSVNMIDFTGRADILEIITPNRNSNIFSPYLYGGIGFINYKTQLNINSTKILISQFPNKVTGVFPIGAGFNYMINDKLDFNFDISYRYSTNDNLDAVISGNSPDAYYLATFGVRYQLGQPYRKTITARSEIPQSGTKKPSGNERDNQKLLDEQPLNIFSDIEVADIIVSSDVPVMVNAGEVFRVSLTITKGTYSGRLKIQQTFSQGFTAFELSSGNENFQFSSPNLTITWDALPVENQFTYVYQVKANHNVSGTFSIPGRVSWPQPGGESVKVLSNYIQVSNEYESDIDKEIQKIINRDTLAVKEKIEDEDIPDYSEINEILAQFENTGIITSETKPPVSVKTQDYLSTKNVTGLEYRIQIGAFRKKDKGSLIRKFNITDPVAEEFSGGWYRYFVGSFSGFTPAKQFRDEFIQRSRHWSAYIVAFRDGVRLKTLPKIR